MDQSWKQPPIVYNRYKNLIVSVEEAISNLGWGFPLAVFLCLVQTVVIYNDGVERGFSIISKKKTVLRCFYKGRVKWIVRR